MSVADVKRVETCFGQAARRAQEIGYDGIELHGCHSYLISQFLSSRINHRTDEYGPQGTLFLDEIIDQVRGNIGSDMILGVRIGCFEPTIGEGILHCQHLVDKGMDFLDVSDGFYLDHDPVLPDGWPYSSQVYGAMRIKEAIVDSSVPVFGVKNITTPEMAEEILQKTGLDVIDIGRGHLVNYNWVNDALAGRDVGECLHCKDCGWHYAARICPGKQRLEKMREA